MQPIPTLYTPRLILRPFTLADVPRVEELIGDKPSAANTIHMPHPCPNGDAESWIHLHQISAELGLSFDFAITLAGTRTPGRELDPSETGHLIGAISIRQYPKPALNQAGIGYWIGRHYWNKGFATEAGNGVLGFAFDRRKYDRVVSCHHADNSASGRVLQKLGMVQQPGTRPCERWGRPIEFVDYVITRDAWSRQRIIFRWKVIPPHAIAAT